MAPSKLPSKFIYENLSKKDVNFAGNPDGLLWYQKRGYEISVNGKMLVVVRGVSGWSGSIDGVVDDRGPWPDSKKARVGLLRVVLH